MPSLFIDPRQVRLVMASFVVRRLFDSLDILLRFAHSLQELLLVHFEGREILMSLLKLCAFLLDDVVAILNFGSQ